MRKNAKKLSGRKSGDSMSSWSSEDSPKTKGGGERLIDSGRAHTTVGTAFVSGDHGLSSTLVRNVSNKACQFKMTFDDEGDDNIIYFGQGGLLRGDRIADTPEGKGTNPKKRRRISFAEHPSFEAIPVTAKHNLELTDDDRNYLRTSIKFVDGNEKDVEMPDGGCTLNDEVEVRKGSADTLPVFWDKDDVSFGKIIDRPKSSLTKKPRLFVKAPEGFRLKVGHKIGIAVYRTFDFTHEDASAPLSVSLVDVYGPKHQVCVYTGDVLEIMEESQTFCHSINTFEGCPGAIVFLLDENQDCPQEAMEGMAMGVHVGGLDDSSNIAFMV
jgi:hypothetical protein